MTVYFDSCDIFFPSVFTSAECKGAGADAFQMPPLQRPLHRFRTSPKPRQSKTS